MPEFRVAVSACLLVIARLSSAGAKQRNAVRGLRVSKGPAVVSTEPGTKAPRDFSVAQSINEVYISIPAQGDPDSNDHPARAIAELHRAHLRVEAFLSSGEADEPGKHRDKLLDHAREIIAFNTQHTAAGFDGIQLDIEPQRPENKGPDNLHFVPRLVDANRANADYPCWASHSYNDTLKKSQ